MKKAFFILLAVLLSVSWLPLPANAVWQAPCSDNPPDCNRPEPLDTSAQAQQKDGNLTIGGQLIIPSGGTFTLQGTANFDSLVNFNAGINVTNNGDAIRGISSNVGNAGIYGQNTAGGWAGSFAGFLGAYNLTIGGPGQGVNPAYQSNGDIYAYNNLGAGGSLTVTGNVQGNFVSQAGAACADTQILKKVGGSWTCSADSGGVPGGANTQVQYNNAGTFAGDSGFTYDAAADRATIGALTVDTDTLYVDATNNRVGIGASAPGYRLDVRDNSGAGGTAIIRINQDNAARLYAGLRIDRQSSEKWFVGMNNSDDKLRLRRNGSTDDVVIDASGNVGIGQVSPGAKLEVAGQVKITGGSPGASKVLTSDATGLATWQTPAVATNYWTDALDHIYANNIIGPSEFKINDAAYGGIWINNNNLVLENASAIYQVYQGQSDPVLIDDMVMFGRRYAVPDCGHYCDQGVDLLNDENLIFGRVRQNLTGNSNQNLLRLQRGDGNDAQIDKFRVDIGGNVVAAGGLIVGSTISAANGDLFIDDNVLVNGNYDIEGGLIVTGGITGAGGASPANFSSGVNISGNFVLNTASIDTAEIADSAITTNKIANLQVTAPKIADSTITFAKIASNGCSANQIMKYNGASWACSAEGGADNLGNHITTQALQVNSGVTGAAPSPQITFANYYDNDVTPSVSHINLYNNQYGFGISANDLDIFSYQNIKFHSSDVSPNYDAVVINADTGALSIEGDMTIAGNLVLNTASINTGEIADSAITSAKIAASAVGTTDIADSAVTTAKIQDLTIAGSDINNGAIAFSKINQNGCTTNQIMKWNGSAWACSADSGGTPGGANTQVQFNNSGAFSGDAGLTYNSGTDSLTVNGMYTGGSANLNLQAGQNLIYGSINSASQGNLLLLRNESSTILTVNKEGDIISTGDLSISGNAIILGVLIISDGLANANMTELGSAGLNIGNGENLLYGNIDTNSTGNLLLLQNENADKFKVDKDGKVTVGGNEIKNSSGVSSIQFSNGNVIIRLGQ